MTILETNEFMKRIKSHYQEFVIDEFKQDEWYKELKKYDYEDVSKKFEEHLRSETYGEYIPKLYFLTKYLIPSNKKGEIKEYTVHCQICNKAVDYKEYDFLVIPGGKAVSKTLINLSDVNEMIHYFNKCS